MLRALPHVAEQRCFALKGGTAINLFLRDLPRLSIDIDLTYLPIDQPREGALRGIGEALDNIAAAVEKSIRGARAHRTQSREIRATSKLVVSQGNSQITIEASPVTRGTVFPTQERELVEKAQELFELSVTVQTVSTEDLYGGKLCAALDRQHPRDLFDVKMLLEHEGITDGIRQAFIVYLASHDRPMNELLDPVRKDIRQAYESTFVGMVAGSVDLEELLVAREAMIKALHQGITQDEKEFLISLKEGAPKWNLLALEGVEKLPAVQWKLQNIRNLGEAKHVEALKKLKSKLGVV